MVELIERPKYVEWLGRWRDTPLIKVITGVRRCGKSTLLELYRRALLREGVRSSNMHTYNLEDPTLERSLVSGLGLYERVASTRNPDETTYVFIDEAQHLEEFERTVAGLNLLPRMDVYVTGSNSRFLTGDLATRLTGRYVEISMLPLSYAEFVSAPATQNRITPLEPGRPVPDPLYQYLETGGFPFAVTLGQDPTMHRQYLSDILSSVILKDVATRQRLVQPTAMLSVATFLFDNIGNLTNTKRISDTLTSAGHTAGRVAVDNYLAGLVDAYLFYPVRRMDLRGRAILHGNAKYYAVDLGMRRAILGTGAADIGRQLENLVYVELQRRGLPVHVGTGRHGEVDFVTGHGDDTTYIQVAHNVDNPNTLQRELTPLKALPDQYPKLLITTDTPGTLSHGGIRQVNVRDWLLDG
ncbi:MAG: ATP-binding protein [Cellulomonadaceae bacterium]|jgi:predicted AAA+ superfamily ATPase|nr:ATP-binding protein [Cellulomonadaceae bacterium]